MRWHPPGRFLREIVVRFVVAALAGAGLLDGTEVPTLPHAQILPASLALGAEHVISIFFKVSVTVAPTGFVQVEAPPGFDFGASCSVLQLEDGLYRHGGGATYAEVDRLPRVLGCTSEIWPVGSEEHTVARIALGRPINAGQRLGFGLSVRNPSRFYLERQAVWAVKTMDADGAVSEQSAGLVAHVAATSGQNYSQAWGLFAQKFDEGDTVEVENEAGEVTTEEIHKPTRLRFGDFTPFPLASRTTYVTIMPIYFPRHMNTTFRVTAPLGFEWETEMPLAEDYWSQEPQGVTMTWPGAFPSVEDAVYLCWDTPMPFVTFTASGRRAKYGFKVGIRLPWWPQTNNQFVFEAGYDDNATDPDDDLVRPWGSIVPGPPQIKVIRGAQVDYISGLGGLSQTVRLVMETATLLLPGEGFLARAGENSRTLYCQCPGEEFLEGMECETMRARLTNEFLMQLLVTGDNTVLPGQKVFPISCENPEENLDTMNWTFGTYEDPTGFPQVSPVDTEAVVPGYAVLQPLASFERWAGSHASLFNPRPLRRCGTILAFSLNARNVTVSGSTARLRAPVGTAFARDCLDDLVLSSGLVFGEGAATERSFEELPEVYLCRGAGHLAYLTFQVPLETEKTYALRVLAQNPEAQPTDNVWSLEVDDQAAQPVAAAVVQRFLDMTLRISVPSLRVPYSDVAGKGGNQVQLAFVATTRANSLELHASEGYNFGEGSGDDSACSGLRLVGRALPGNDGEFLVVPKMTACACTGRIINVTLQIEPAYMYTFDVTVLTPESVSAPGMFWLYSTAQDFGLGDEYWVESPLLLPGLSEFVIQRLSGEATSSSIVRSRFTVAFTNRIEENDRIELQFPPAFEFPDLDSSTFVCPFAWVSPAEGPPAICSCLTEKVHSKDTTRCSVAFVANSTQLRTPLPSGELLVFDASVVNPSTVPAVFDNMLRLSLSAQEASEPKAIGHHRGWVVVPTINDLRLAPAAGSPLRAAAPSGTLFLDFVPANDAWIVRLTGRQPSGWDFTASRLCEADGGKCRAPDAAEAHVLRVSGVDLASGVQSRFEIRKVRFADVGGTSVFVLETFLEDQIGKLVAVDAGELDFHLPGALRVHAPRLRTRTGAVRDPEDALWSTMPPRLGVPEAAIVWQFDLTLPAARGDWMLFRAGVVGIRLTVDLVGLEHISTGSAEQPLVATTSEQVGAREVRLILKEELVARVKYRAYLSAVMTKFLPASPSSWLNVSLCRAGLPFPVATNDAQVPDVPDSALSEETWFVSSELAFSLLDIATAPLTVIQVVGDLPNQGTYSTVDLIAPYGVLIADPCAPSVCEAVDTNIFGTGQHAALGLEVAAFKLVITLPDRWSQNRNRWVALLRKPGGTALAAPQWGYSDKLTLRMMPANIAYAAVAGEAGVSLTVSFEIGQAAAAAIYERAQCYVEVSVPSGYAVRCGLLFQVITAPSDAKSYCVEEEGSNDRLSVLMTGVSFTSSRALSFSFGLDVPPETPDRNLFQVVVKSFDNNTVDANTLIQGIAIPANRLQSSVSWQVSGFESLAWLEAWAELSRSTGAFAQGLADSLQVVNDTISIEDVTVALVSETAGTERRLSGLKADLQIDYSVELRLDARDQNHIDRLTPLFAAADYAAEVTASVAAAISGAGLAPLALTGCVSTPPVQVMPPNVTDPTLAWESSDAEQPTQVSLGIFFKHFTEDVRAVLFVLPGGFEHRVDTLRDLHVRRRSAEQDFPVTKEEGSWIDTRSPGMLRILLASGARIEEGGYSFEVPVQVPYEVPSENIWFICLCRSRMCDSPSHSSVVTSFALPGFKIGEVHPSRKVASDASRVGRAWLVALLILCAALPDELRL